MDRGEEDKNPAEDTGWTSLHFDAQNGHTTICQLILDRVEDKNPAAAGGVTPLHLAAYEGYKAICQLILREESR